ncbi:FtsX-like permease family protein [Clostridium senegalense]|uniref:FtsX-like permease family protein n=1 Tax=Clostridium senegalense TaxID=1465809 RepID=UPI00028981BD|nr:FtsX-like permease family protein [Clostridium senegalense]
MNFEKILFKSTIRNLKLYLYYLISSCAAVFIFIITSAIINHPVLIESVKGDLHFDISYMKFQVILISIFFIMYSLNTFIKMRKKEFGVLMALGVDYKDFYKFL